MTPTEQPEDLRAAVDQILKREQEYVQQCTLANIEAAQTSGQWIIHDPNRAASLDDILRLYEAAALAALPKKHETINGTDMWNIDIGHHMSQEKLMENSYWNGLNSAITTAQANIHSVFGGTDS